MSPDPRALSPHDVADALASTSRIVESELTLLPPDLLRWKPAPDEWCILEAVGHLIEAERRAFAGRIREMLAQDEPICQTWDPAAVARGRNDCEQSADLLLAELVELRRESVAMVRGLVASDLERGGEHPHVGRLSVGDLLNEWVHHDRNHVRQMFANVQAFVWPRMGNAQRFTSG